MIRDNGFNKSRDDARKYIYAVAKRVQEIQVSGIPFTKCPDNYEIEAEVGFGRYSRVFKAISKKDNKYVVLKILNPTSIKRVIREISILNLLSGGPNIVKFYEVVINNMSDCITLVLEHVNNETNKTLYKTFTNEDVKYYIYQILLALEYSRNNKIMHRDVKPSNIMIDHRNRKLRLCDWGLAEYYKHDTTYSVRVSSLNFKGPELILGYPKYDYSLDIWCLGCVFAEMLFLHHPFFPGVDLNSQMVEITFFIGSKCVNDYIEKYKNDFDAKYENIKHYIINFNMRDIEPKSFDKYINCNNFDRCNSDALNLLRMTLTCDQQLRPTPTEAMAHPYFDSIRNTPT